MRFLIFIFCLFLSAPVLAQDVSPIVIDVAEEQVDITTGFDGARIVVFGTAPPQDELAVTIKGPSQNMVIRRKANILGLWVNSQSLEFSNISSYYSYAVTQHELKKRVGLDSLEIIGTDASDPLQQKEFQDALIRNLQAQGLYATDSIPIVRLGGNLFRTEFMLPSNTPIGAYTIEAIVFRQGNVFSRTQRIMQVVQTGMTGHILTFANDYGFAYALAGLMMAIMAGLGSYFFSRRDA